jgi:ribonucleoside-triphosphate reductase
MAIEQVLKRDGQLVPFDRTRIEKAIWAAANAADAGETRLWAEALSWAVCGLLEEHQNGNSHPPQVEQIQDVVEEVLIKSGNARVAKAFILYREKRAEARQGQRILLDGEQLVSDYLKVSDWRVSENSNMNYSLQGLNFYLASSVTARYWLSHIYPPEVQQAHTQGDLHLHDLGMFSVYCCGWDLQDLLRRGFGGVASKVESLPPKHLHTALGQLVNFFYTLQGESAGAVAVSNFDTLLAPFIRYDGLDHAAVRQAVQEFIFNLNVPTRVGFQTPFTNLTLDLTAPAHLAEQAVVIGGKAQETTYGEYQVEMDSLNRAFAEVMLDGDAKHRVFTFPIPTYNLSSTFDWENPTYEEIWRMTARYGIPYFANFINSDMKPEDTRSMCCRLRLDNRELRKRLGGIFASAPLTGSVGVVTINLPRLAFRAASKSRQHSEADYFQRLEKQMEIARTSLEIKRKTLEALTQQGLYPYSRYYLDSVYQRNGAYWCNHFSTIGLVGMHEACLNLLGVGIDSPQGCDLAEKTLQTMQAICHRFQEETGHLYNLEATPAEGAAYRLARLDRRTFPSIRTAGTNTTPYYTNSTQLPVGYSDDLFATLRHQERLQCLYTGGTVQHIFLGEQLSDWKQARLLIRRAAENFRLPYFTLTPTFSICPVHGYLAGEHKVCPQEHSPEAAAQYGSTVPCEVYSRVVGYLRPVQNWNEGKKQEFSERVPFDTLQALAQG